MIRPIYFLLICFACTAQSPQGVEKIDADQLIELKDSGVIVVDIRTKKEYDNGHIPGVLHIDYFASDFMDQIKSLDQTKPIIIHCAVGGRSGKAAQKMQKAGFTTIYDYSGGFSDWKLKGLEIE